VDLELKDKVVVVTGASRGIGLATSRVFAREGAKLVMAARTAQTLDDAAEALRKEYGQPIHTVACDLTREEECIRLIESAEKEFGRIDVLVNNAAGKLPVGPFDTLTNEEWLTAWTNKVQVYVTLARLVFPIMERQKGGRIINVIGAHAAKNPAPSYLPVGFISAGLVNFVKGLADLGAKNQILVTGVSPAGVDTGERWQAWISRRAASEGKTIQEVNDEKAEYSLGRPAKPEEVADLICFLGSARASFITGIVLTIDGNVTRGVSL